MTTLSIEPATVTVEEAAHILGISRNLAYQLAGEGQLPGAFRLGRRIVVSLKFLTSYLEKGGEP